MMDELRMESETAESSHLEPQMGSSKPAPSDLLPPSRPYYPTLGIQPSTGDQVFKCMRLLGKYLIV